MAALRGQMRESIFSGFTYSAHMQDSPPRIKCCWSGARLAAGPLGGSAGEGGAGGHPGARENTVGRKAVVSLGGGFGEGFLAAPGLNDDIFGHAGDEDFVPAHYGFAVLGDNFLNS